ncbi:MAG: DUF3341 domain-containing protein [Dehalococcoidia bacterium]|nr:DUF3341 domain-containing protein [Dehalococcoidia bacterium]MDW8119987.1 DUF3341 domain-containing protein [Chloroflexota bacterium]
MAERGVLGLFSDVESAANAGTALREAGIEFEVLSGSPYPEGAFSEHTPPHRLYVFPFLGALCGFSVAILLTAGTQLAYPLVTGGKPVLSIPPMAIITYEGTMLGAILFTVLGVVFESRLPRPIVGLYDKRITEGWIGLLVVGEEGLLGPAERILRQHGAVEVKRG